MLIFENIGIALSSIKANLTRSILTMLGIIIGVAAVIGIFAISDAMNSEITGLFADGADTVNIGLTPKQDDDHGMPIGRGFNRAYREMSREDYINKDIIDDICEKYSDRVKGVQLVVNVGSEAEAVYQGETSTVKVEGDNKDALDASELNIVSGHEFYDTDYEQGHRVCLVDADLVEDLFNGNNEDALGHKLSVKVDNVYHTYNIVGVYEEDSDSSYGGWDTEDSTTIYIPLLVAMSETHSMYKFDSITVVANDFNDAESLSEEIPNYLNRRYYKNNEYYETEGFCFASLISEVSDLMSKISLGLACIAGISLLVGGIGVMNIMLVSITERTKEIGTRKALGATNVSIRLQFVIEAIVLCLVGGLIGILIGAGLGAIGCKLMESEFVLTAKSVIIAFSFAAAVGLFFGYYPANKAALMNPIDALRYE